MNSDPAEAATLLECLRAPFRGLYLRFPYFLRPFDEFIFLGHYNPNVKKYARRKKKPKELQENVSHIGSQFYGFLSNALHLVEEHLGRSPCNGAEGDERMQEEKITELFGIYRLITRCLLCIPPCLSGKPYTVQLVWGKLVMRLGLWNKHSEAKEEGVAIFKSIRTLLATSPSRLNSTVHFLLDPSAAKICSHIDVKWDRKSSLVVDVLKMSLKISFCWKEVDLAKYVDALLGFISKFVEGFYLIGKVACKDGSKLSLEVGYNMQQPSKALELCCKTILKHIQLLCQPPLTYSTSIQGSVASKDSIKGVIKNAFTKFVRIIDVLHKLDASNSRAVLNNSIYELSVVEISFPNSSLSFPLVKQQAKELLAYDQLEAWNPILCHKMEIKVIDVLLMNVFNVRDFNLQRARVLLRKGLVLRTHGIENLISCFDCLSEAISLLVNITNDSSEAKTLGYHHLAFAYFLRAQFAQETKDWELIQCDVQCGINLLYELDINAYHTLTSELKSSVKSTISILCCTLDLLSLKGFLKFHSNMYTLINLFCKYENFSLEKCMAMLWTGRRLGHFLCASPIDPDLVSRISQLLDNNINSFSFWTKCLKSSSFSLLMFIQNFLICDSILNEENVQQIEGLYSCKLTVEGVKVAVSFLLFDVSAKNEMTFFAGQIYYNLAESLFAGGRVFDVGIFYDGIGDGVQAEIHFSFEKRLSFLQSLPHFQIAFSCALGQLYCKKLFWDLSEEVFNFARMLFQENDIIISCRHCKLIFEVTIDMQIVDLLTERLNKDSHVQSLALDFYRSLLRKLSNDNVEGSFIGCWESDRKLVPCHICSFLKNSFDSLKVEQQSSVTSTMLLHGNCSFDFGCSDGGVLTKVECLRCLCLKMIKEGTMQNFIHFKWQCQ